ncbi:MAG: endonuclease I, partial [Alphaproteobacteria bacterium TMED87]
WNKTDPVDEWECRRAGLIKSIQGSSNPVVEADCLNL